MLVKVSLFRRRWFYERSDSSKISVRDFLCKRDATGRPKRERRGAQRRPGSRSQCRKAIKYQFHPGHRRERRAATRRGRNRTGRERSFSNLHGTVSIREAILKHRVHVTREKKGDHVRERYRRYYNATRLVFNSFTTAKGHRWLASQISFSRVVGKRK